MNERAILCGDAPSGALPFGAGELLRLRLWGPHANVSLRMDDIHQSLFQDIPSPFLDLIEIATYVYCADQATPRGGSGVEDVGENWRRRLFLRIPVRHPELWRDPQLLEPLGATLSFLSEDEYHFDFVPLKDGPPLQKYLTFAEDDRSLERPEEVVLFSGGLDSLGGAIQEAVVDKRRVALVTHKSTHKLARRHARLKDLLAQHAGSAPLHIPVRIHKRKGLSREYTQRSRSFLYASLGATVAQMFGLARIRFYENGVVSLNLPPSAQVVGARATRTTHPQVIQGFAAILSAVAGKRFAVENPFLWKTKTEVLQQIAEARCSEMIPFATSCTHTWEMTRLKTHCGTCSQCIDRRFAALAAGVEAADPAEAYKVDLLVDPRAEGESRTMLANYVETASEISKMIPVDFFSRYGEASRVFKHLDGSADTAAMQLFELHQRHARQVTKVVDEALSRHASAIRKRELPASCLLRLVCDAAAPASASASLPAGTGGAPLGDHAFRRKGPAWAVRFAGGEGFILLPSKGAAYLQILLSNPGVVFSAADLACRVAREPQRYVLGDGGDATSTETLGAYRARHQELQEELEKAQRDNDLAAQQRIQHDMDAFREQIQRDTALGGRIRKFTDDRERVRKRVCNAIRRSLEEIARDDKRLAEHLDPKATARRLTLGKHISYVAPDGVRWHS